VMAAADHEPGQPDTGYSRATFLAVEIRGDVQYSHIARRQLYVGT
jgi:hypothetical protein